MFSAIIDEELVSRLVQQAPDRLIDAGTTALTIGLIVLLSWIAIKLADAFTSRVFKRKEEEHSYLRLDTKKTRTLTALARSVVRYVVYFVAGLAILQKLGVPASSLIATAGIGGLAIGFGAQSLVKDVITGFFLLLEDQFGIGDYVELAGVSGTVEEIGLRVTKVRDFGGQLHIIPNSEITRVTNYMGPAMRVLFGVQISYESDVDKAIQVLREGLAGIESELTDIVEPPQVLGVSSLAESGVELLILARAKPMSQWAVERELKRRIKMLLGEAGIEIPYPRRYVILSHPPQ